MIGSAGSSVTIASIGVHAPGNSIGAQQIASDYLNQETLRVEAIPDEADKVVVAGTIDITGAVLDLVLLPTDVPSWNVLNGPFTIIDKQSTGTVTGTFIDPITQNLLFLDANLAYDGGDGNEEISLPAPERPTLRASFSPAASRPSPASPIPMNADHIAAAFQAFDEFGDGIGMRSARFERFAGLAHVSLHTAGFTEQGDSTALSGSNGNIDVTFIHIARPARPTHSGSRHCSSMLRPWRSVAKSN